MSIVKVYKEGLTNIWQHKKILFVVYLFNILFAYLMSMRVSMILSTALDNTTIADDLLNKFDFTVLGSIIDQYGKGVKILPLLATYIVLYLILNIFFAGGIIKIFSSEKKSKVKEFISECAEYFSRFFRLFLFSLIFIVIALISIPALSGIFSLFTPDAESEILSTILFFVNMSVFIFLLMIVNMLFDYAKIKTVTEDVKAMGKTVIHTLKFIVLNFGRVFFLYLLYFLTAIVLYVFYLVLENYLDVNSGFRVFLFFVLSQIFIIFKLWIRMSFFNGQLIYFKYLVNK